MTSASSDTHDTDDRQLQDLLQRYDCPLPFHAARAQLLGAFASPIGETPARDVLAGLWGSTRPAFASSEAQDREIDRVLRGLADRLTLCLATGAPFRLSRVQATADRASLGQLALIRRQEIDAFIAGLFAGQEVVELTRPAFAALDSMSNIRSLLQQLRNFLDDPTQRTTPEGLAASLRSVEDLLKPLEEAIDTVIRQCAGVRVQALRRLQSERNQAPMH